jgi:hypothetical protein
MRGKAVAAADDGGSKSVGGGGGIAAQAAEGATAAGGEAGADTTPVMEAAFRGRKLSGRVQSLPKGYTGRVYKQDRIPSSDEEERKWTPVAQFTEFTCWNLETEPSVADPITLVMEWIGIATAIHAPMGGSEEGNGPRRSPRPVRVFRQRIYTRGCH